MTNSTFCEFAIQPSFISPFGWSTDALTARPSFSIANSNPSVLTAPLPIIPTLPNYVCSKLILAAQLPSLTPATGYTIQLTNIFNNTDVCASPSHHQLLWTDCGLCGPANFCIPGLCYF